MASAYSPAATFRILPILSFGQKTHFDPKRNVRYADCVQPEGLKTRLVEGGLFASLLAGRLGLATSSPPQFGHWPLSTVSAHDEQNVHSNEQMRASLDSGGKSLSQHSQLGRNSSIFQLLLLA